MISCSDSLKAFCPKGVTAGKRFIPFMSRKCNVSARERNIRNTNSATRYPSYALQQVLFLKPSLSAMNMTNTIGPSLEQVEWLTGKKVKVLAGDRGYRGKKEMNGTKIMIPDVPKKSDSRCQKLKKYRLFCKRAGIEATIDHLESDYRLGLNFYKGDFGDTVNVLLAAAAYNFKRAMKALLYVLQKISEILYEYNILHKWSF